MKPVRVLLLCLAICTPVLAQEDGWDADGFRPLPLHQIAAAVAQRYDGRLLSARIRPPRPDERDRGAALIYRLRLLTPQQNLLEIRVDARDGRFLSVSGRGQLAARKPAPGGN